LRRFYKQTIRGEVEPAVQIFGDETRPRLLFVFSAAVSQMIAALRVILATLFAARQKREWESSSREPGFQEAL
jgi:hypothetical protein